MRAWVVAVLSLGLVYVAVRAAQAQPSRISLDDAIRGYEQTSGTSFNGTVDDWSTHHVVFSAPQPGSAREAKVQRDPRYWMQQVRSHLSTAPKAAQFRLPSGLPKRGRGQTPKNIGRDWSVSLGSGATAGAGVFPAKFSFSSTGTPSCTNDFVVYNTGLVGSSSQASIVAFNNLYKSPTCSGAVPATLWAYNTGGKVVTSPVLSYPNGDQVAFVQSVGTVANLVVLKWANTGSAVTTLTSNSNYPSCTAPCMIQIPLKGNPADTLSSPFWDLASDSIFVGDAVGVLHKFSPIFTGAPKEITTGGFPITVSQSSTKRALASPVYDSGTKQVFVGDTHAAGSSGDGEVHVIATASGTATLTNSAATICHGIGYADPPLLDPTAGMVYFACGNDQGGGNCTSTRGVACIRQFPENFAAGSAGTGEPLGATADAHVYPGAFDNIYFNSSESSPTGSLYVCGNPGGAPALYRVPITSNVVGTPMTIKVLGSATASCSPVTEFYNSAAGANGTDWLFLSVTASGNAQGRGSGNCTGACVYSFANTANPPAPLSPGTKASFGISSAGGSSGIVVDNDNSVNSSSTVANIYYSTLTDQACGSGGTGGCAVQASQGALN